nr:type VII secretion target [Mycobacteroides abscessus]
MSGLSVDADGLRLAGARSESLAADLSAPSAVASGSNSDPTVGAVRAVSALIDAARADQTAYLSGHAQTLRSGASAYENTDKGSAGKINGAR